MYGSLKSSLRRSAWVPLPAPGGPRRMRFSSLKARTLLQEALVVAHHQLGLELLHRVQGDADDDQQRGSAEEEVGAGLVYEDGWQRGDGRQVERARKGQASQDAIEELRRRAARPHPRNEPAVLLEVVGLVDRVEGDRRVEVGEDDDEYRLAHDVGPIVGREE